METVDAIMKLNKIFKTNNWIEKDVDEFIFNNFCKLFTNLTEKQRALIVELTERYNWISFNDYQSKILSTLDNVEEEKLSAIKKIYLFPIIKPEDEGKIKSGQFLIYQIKSYKKFLKKYENIKFEILSKFEQLDEKHLSLKKDEALFLIDDYIGSGETLNACLDVIQSNNSVSDDKINVITIASQKEIFLQIKKRGISIYSDFISKKGITDFNEKSLSQEKISIMLEIEKMIPGGSHYSLGYNESEALITLMRTPDNTFPIFWKTYRKGSEKYDAPFSREELVEL